MSSQNNEFFMDKMISKYQSLSKKQKSIIHISFGGLLVLFAIGQIFNAGEAFGEFIYYISN